jgi:hypothetical protein
MDIDEFLKRKDEFKWAMEPCLYIVKQLAGIPTGGGGFTENHVHRCGTSGTHMLKDGATRLTGVRTHSSQVYLDA